MRNLTQLLLLLFVFHVTMMPVFGDSGEALPVVSGVVPHHLLAKEIMVDFFSFIAKDKQLPDTIILLSPDHLNSAALERGNSFISVNWESNDIRLGDIAVDKELLKKLAVKIRIRQNQDTVLSEFGIMNLLLLIKEYLPEVKIVPILIPANISREEVSQLVNAINQISSAQTIMVASVDFSHYLPSRAASFHDVKSIRVLLNGEEGHFENIEVDSWQSLYAVRLFARLRKKESPVVIAHKNSVDFLSFSSDKTTSYFSVVFEEGETKDDINVETILLAGDMMLARGRGYASDTKKYGGITSEYFVDHKPFIELDSPVGHAVRMLYLCCGATDVYLETGNEDIKKALEGIWKSLVSKKMYITGGAGSRHEGESFGADYELPNKRAYAETCAAIANFMWNYRMLLATADARYADVMEQTLYNGLLSGISLDGIHYFYDNPLESDGSHRRREWFECACCPPNIARLITSLPGYLYSTSKDDTALWINLYEDSKVNWKTVHGNMVLNLKSNYPWDSTISIEVAESDVSVPVSIFIRIPAWVRDFSVKINGDNVNDEPAKGYIELKKVWKAGDLVDIVFAMKPELILCHPFSEENRGRIAVKRGPMVYCAEGIDNREFDVRTLILNYDSEIKEQMEEVESLGNLVTLSGKGLAQDLSDWGENLYIPANGHISRRKPVEYKLIPYFAWANREASPMVVWMNFA